MNIALMEMPMKSEEGRIIMSSCQKIILDKPFSAKTLKSQLSLPSTLLYVSSRSLPLWERKAEGKGSTSMLRPAEDTFFVFLNLRSIVPVQ